MNVHVSKLCAAAAFAVALGACSSTSFMSTWHAPDAQPISLQPSDKVIALVIANNESMRRAGEANLADELSARGFQGVPAYTLISFADVKDEEKANRAINASGAKAVVVLRPTGTSQEISSTPSMYASPYYGGFWGGGYYGYGWGGAYMGSEIRTDTFVHIETMIYDLTQNKLIWAGQSKTMNPSNVEQGIKDLADAVGKELRAAGLVAATK